MTDCPSACMLHADGDYSRSAAVSHVQLACTDLQKLFNLHCTHAKACQSCEVVSAYMMASGAKNHLTAASDLAGALKEASLSAGTCSQLLQQGRLMLPDVYQLSTRRQAFRHQAPRGRLSLQHCFSSHCCIVRGQHCSSCCLPAEHCRARFSPATTIAGRI